MKAAPLTHKPDFELMTLDDLTSFYHLQMPRWLLSDPKYRELMPESKLVYTVLLNRHQLSRLNNWINEEGEVFIIFTRKKLAEDVCISYRKVIDCMKELSEYNLIWERRCGRGEANQIYLAKVVLSDDAQYQLAPFVGPESEEAGAINLRDADSALLKDVETDAQDNNDDLRSADLALLDDEMPQGFFLKCGTGTSGDAEPALQDMPNPHTSYIDINITDVIKKDSQSVCQTKDMDFATSELRAILTNCNLWIFSQDTAQVFENAIERLYYSKKFKIGDAVLPMDRIRERLRNLNDVILRDAEYKISQNTERKIRNSTAYIMAVIFNSITEVNSDIMSDPYLNTLRNRPPIRGDDERGN